MKRNNNLVYDPSAGAYLPFPSTPSLFLANYNPYRAKRESWVSFLQFRRLAPLCTGDVSMSEAYVAQEQTDGFLKYTMAMSFMASVFAEATPFQPIRLDDENIDPLMPEETFHPNFFCANLYYHGREREIPFVTDEILIGVKVYIDFLYTAAVALASVYSDGTIALDELQKNTLIYYFNEIMKNVFRCSCDVILHTSSCIERSKPVCFLGDHLCRLVGLRLE